MYRRPGGRFLYFDKCIGKTKKLAPASGPTRGSGLFVVRVHFAPPASVLLESTLLESPLAVRKEDIEPPEPRDLPPRISFIESAGGSAGYYVRFKDISEQDLDEEGDSEEKDAPKEEGDPKKGSHPEEEGGPIRKYVPTLQFDSQEEALQAAISFRDRKAKELGLPVKPSRGPHEEEPREKMSAALGLPGTQRARADLLEDSRDDLPNSPSSMERGG